MKKIFTTLALSFVYTASVLADGDDQNLFPTAFLNFDGSYITHKSLLVESNDTGIGINYAFGFYAGQQRTVGVLFRNDTSKITFKLNSSSIQTSWQDNYIRYRWDYVYFGAVISRAAMIVVEESETVADAQGSGYGGNIGFVAPMKKGSWHVDITFATIGAVRELEQRTFSMGSRMDADIGLSFDVTKRLVDFLMGVRYRTVAAATDAGGTDVISSVYFGFQFAGVF